MNTTTKNEHAEPTAAEHALELHRTAQRAAEGALDELGDALEDLALLAAELAAADSEEHYEVSVEDLEEDTAAGSVRRCLVAQVLTIAAKVALGRSLARSARRDESDATFVAQRNARDEGPAPQ